ncbi:Ves allergen [Trema orientale]|uniref:Ves allergen n=1 Tax=Trema orientale TaxID=63057 RepID=A0A2P5FJP0_TREOI|nr:Ves allergen [Trema orientale]
MYLGCGIINSHATNDDPSIGAEIQTEIETELKTTPFQNPPDNETVFQVSKKLCRDCFPESMKFLFEHNLVRARKGLLPLVWDTKLKNYARSWANKRKADCALEHSFADGQFDLGENIFWGGGPGWNATDAVTAWAEEEKYYNYGANSCAQGKMCGHYTQIVWRSTKRVGCAKVLCNNNDVFMTCNYDPPGNYFGERPY